MALMTLLIGCVQLITQEGADLKAKIEHRLAAEEGTFAVAFYDVSGDRQVLINARESFHAASTMKTPVMIELFRESEQGVLDLDDSVLVKNEFRSIVDGSRYALSMGDDSDDAVYRLLGHRVPLRQLIRHMITTSSNLATNILIEIADAQRVTASMRTLGADSIAVLRGVEDLKAFEAGLNNRTTAYDLLRIFRALVRNEAAGVAACREMRDILADQTMNDLLPAGLPAGIRVEHKTGWITGIEHDGGIVVLPDGREYVLIVLSRGMNDRAKGKKAIADISRIVYEFMTGD